MAKRKLPPHIVLPNGQWRFVKKGSRAAGKTGGRRVGSMAKKKTRRRFGGGIGSMVKPLLFGAAVGWANKKFAPQFVPMQSTALGAGAAYMTGSRGGMGLVAGAAGGYLGGMLASGTGPTGPSGIILY